jgi:hypothetical protein
MAKAFKEWALVCEALGRGEQSVILRKGGISEGRSGFGFDHDDFFLFPTWYHGQIDKVRANGVRMTGVALPDQDPERITVSFMATLEWAGRIGDKEALHSLRELHVLDDSVIEERFVYDTRSGSLGGEGINLAFVRVFRLEPSVVLPMEEAFGGCRSWIDLPEIEPSALVSVLSDEEHRHRRDRFAELLGISFG